MASFCRWVGGFVLVLSTVALVLEQLAYAGAGAALSLVWLIAGQLADAIARQPRRDQPPPPSSL